jgi:rubrerythrin
MSDLINRQDVINSIVERTHMDWESMKTLHPMLEVIENLPSVYRKNGRWIYGTERFLLSENDDAVVYGYRVTWTCSICGYKRYLESKPNDNFCKWCGANMRESHDSD